MIRAQRTMGSPEEAGISARIAVYARDDGEPSIIEVSAASPGAATAKITRLVMEAVNEAGGKTPEEAVREVVENLVHSGYRGVVVSVLAGGNVVRVSDRGPGVADKERAMQFGFSGATPEALAEIRGVGAGLGMARAAAEAVGGAVTLEDNIGGGTVATVSARAEDAGGVPDAPGGPGVASAKSPKRALDGVPRMNISERQRKVLVTVLECGEVGPSTVAGQLDMSVSTAYRDLSVLEEHGLVLTAESGKRVISSLGRDVVEAIVGSWVK